MANNFNQFVPKDVATDVVEAATDEAIAEVIALNPDGTFTNNDTNHATHTRKIEAAIARNVKEMIQGEEE